VLHQNILPCVSAPGLNWLVTKVCRAQIENMLRDLKQEISRVKNGMSYMICLLSIPRKVPAAGVANTTSLFKLRKTWRAAGDPILAEQQDKLTAGERSWAQPNINRHQMDMDGA
jgi:hypothetical protein